MSVTGSAPPRTTDRRYTLRVAVLAAAGAQVMTMLLASVSLLALAARSVPVEQALAQLRGELLLPLLVEASWITLALRAGMVLRRGEPGDAAHFIPWPSLWLAGAVVTALRLVAYLALGPIGAEWLVAVAAPLLPLAVVAGGWLQSRGLRRPASSGSR